MKSRATTFAMFLWTLGALGLEGPVLGAQEPRLQGTGSFPQAFETRVTAPPCLATESQIVVPDPSTMDLGFGWEVALVGDQLLVAAHPGSFYELPGAVHVFDRTPGGFVFRKRITPSTSAPGDGFGRLMAASEDRLLVSDRFDVFVFGRDVGGPGEWGEITQIPSCCSTFTCGFDLDGDVLALGECGGGYGLGVVLIRERDAGGPDAWEITATIPTPDPPPPPLDPYSHFGLSIAISGDTVVATAANSRFHPYTNYAFAFERDLGGPGAWGLASVAAGPLEYAAGWGNTLDLDGDLHAPRFLIRHVHARAECRRPVELGGRAVLPAL